MLGRRGHLVAAVATAIAALAALALALSGLAPAAADGGDPRPAKDPLSITITSLSPSSLPATGPMTIRGTVTNDDTVTWSGVKVYPFLDTDAVTTGKALAAQVAAPVDSFVGYRINDSGVEIGDLDPGESAHYVLTVPRHDLAQLSDGVHWLGARAYGANGSGISDDAADGRARTFLPVMRHRKNIPAVPVSLLLPVRARVLRTASGRVADEAAWTASLTHGHLASVVSFGTTQSDVTWLVDPAVLDAVRQLAAGNPARNLSADAPDEPAPSSSASPGTSSSTASDAVPSASPSADPQDPFRSDAMSAAQTWLRSFLTAVAGHEVLALPYGDPDLSAVAAHDGGRPTAATLISDARAASTSVMSELGINALAADAPLDGYVDAKGLALAQGGVTVLTSRAVKGDSGPVVSLDGDEVDLTSAAAGAGGPGPGNPYAGVALRQRILAQAAVTHDRPLLVSLPAAWEAPRDAAGFLGAFKAPWLSLQPLTTAADMEPTTLPVSRLVYPPAEARREVSAQVFDHVRQMIGLGDALDDILPDNTGVANEVLRDALTSTSYSARGGRGRAPAASSRALTAQLAKVRLGPPPAVTLSGASGRFAVSVTNHLDERVTVEVNASGDGGITVKQSNSVTIPADSTTSVLMSASVSSPGVHSVLLHLTTSTGVPMGSSVVLRIRSAQVSKVIWGFIGLGVGVLAIAIAIRLIRRVRRSRSEG